MPPPQQWEMLSKASFAFPAAFPDGSPAPGAPLPFWPYWGHIPRNVLSQQSHFPLQGQDHPDTVAGLSSLAPLQLLHCIFPWINPCVSHPALYQGVAMGCSLMSFFLDPKLSKHFPSTDVGRGEAPITSTIINYKSILSFQEWLFSLLACIHHHQYFEKYELIDGF